MEYEECPHGKHIGAVCLECAEEYINAPAGSFPKEPYVDPYDDFDYDVTEEPTGLDARYYDIPGHIRDCQDLIEWLNLDFSNGNILKSIVRENNPHATKDTEALYEAEKRFYFASRHLENMRRLCKDRDVS